MRIIWTLYGLICLASMVIYQKLSKTKEFKKLLSYQEGENERYDDKSLWQDFWIVRYEVGNIVIAYFLQMLIFPAIFLSLTVSKSPKFP